MSEELLPCPFCGNHKANLFPPTCLPSTPYDPAGRLYPVVRCAQCYVDVPGKNLDYKGRSAIAAWNKRAAISVSDGGGSDARGASALEKKEAVTRNMAVLQKTLNVLLRYAGWERNYRPDGTELPMSRPHDVQEVEELVKEVLSEHDGQPETEDKPNGLLNTIPAKPYYRDDMLEAWVAGRSNLLAHGESPKGDAPDFATWIKNYAPSVGAAGQPESASGASSIKDSSPKSPSLEAHG